MAGFGSKERNRQLLRKAKADISKAVGRTLDRAGFEGETIAKASMPTSGPSSPGSPPAVGETGLLRASITHEIDAKRGVVRIGSNHPGARIQELGGPIVAKGGYLVFPIRVGAQISRRGRPTRGKARVITRRGIRMRSARESGRGMRAGGLYKWVKVRRVVLPPRPYLRPMLAKLLKKIPAILKREMAKIKTA